MQAKEEKTQQGSILSQQEADLIFAAKAAKADVMAARLAGITCRSCTSWGYNCTRCPQKPVEQVQNNPSPQLQNQ